MKPTIRAVFLDFDGTLVDSEPLHFDCWRRAIAPYGGRIAWEDYTRRLVGISDVEAAEILLTEAGREPLDGLVDTACQAKKQMYRKRFCEELTISHELQEWITNPPLNLSLGIVSSSHTIEVEPLLIKAGIRESLGVMVCGDNVKKLKPDPEPYLLALNLLNNNGVNINSRQCRVFEDSAAGVTSARRAGMQVQRVSSPDVLLEALHAEFRGE